MECLVLIHYINSQAKPHDLLQESKRRNTVLHMWHDKNNRPVPQISCVHAFQSCVSAVYIWTPLPWMPSSRSRNTWHPDSLHSLQSSHQPPTHTTPHHHMHMTICQCINVLLFLLSSVRVQMADPSWCWMLIAPTWLKVRTSYLTSMLPETVRTGPLTKFPKRGRGHSYGTQ